MSTPRQDQGNGARALLTWRVSRVHQQRFRSRKDIGLVHDDRKKFLEDAQETAAEMARDARLQRDALAVYAAADNYAWSYQFTWLGTPIIQSPVDIVVGQEIVWTTKPDLIVETGVARGGSVMFWASMLHMLGGPRKVVGIDLDIRAHNRQSIDACQFADQIQLIEGSSTDRRVVDEVIELARRYSSVMVVLDSNHTHSHVLEELHLYSALVTLGQYLIVSDTVVEDIPEQKHRPRAWGPGNNPGTAVREFLSGTHEFERAAPIDNKLLLSSSRGGYLQRVIAPSDAR